MEEPNTATQKNILIVAYWPRRQPDELNIGYGMDRLDRFSRIAGTALSISSNIFSLLFEAKLRPALRPAAHVLPFILAGLALALFTTRFRQYRGYYQLDDQGVPVAYLNRLPPDAVKGRFGVGRGRFLEQVK